MNPINEHRDKLLLLFWIVFCLSLTLSPALISISLACIALMGIKPIGKLKADKSVFIISLLFLGFYFSSVVSAFYSSNFDEALRKLILKLPILITPLLINAFWVTDRKLLPIFSAIFCYAAFLPASVSVFNYLSNKDYFDILILQSKPLPIEFGYGIYHIQFSIFLALATALGAYECIRAIKHKNKSIIVYFIALITAFNFVFIHILSARTGLISLYMALLILLISASSGMRSKYKFGILTLLIIVPITMYFMSSSLRNRLTNTIIDMKVVMNSANPNDYSFAMRVEAWKNATELIKEHPLLGVGIGDAEIELKNNFEKAITKLEPKNRKNPHFQLLETAVQSGLISALLLLSLIIYTVASQWHKNPLAVAFMLLLLIASCFESILERQASVVCFAAMIAYSMGFKNTDKVK